MKACIVLIFIIVGTTAKVHIDTTINKQDTVITFKQYYPSGSVKSKRVVKNGNPHDEQVEYYENGMVKSSIFYDGGCPKDTAKRYFSDGTRWQISTYNNCREQGQRIIWSQEKDTVSFGYYTNGLPTGLHQEWYAKNRPKSFITYNSSGQKHGLSRTWRENGTLQDSSIYESGIRIEEYATFFNGSPRLHLRLRPGDTYSIVSGTTWSPAKKKSGVISGGSGSIVRYFENPDTLFEETWLNGVQISSIMRVAGVIVRREEHYANGALRLLLDYADGAVVDASAYPPDFSDSDLDMTEVREGNGRLIEYSMDGKKRWLREFRAGREVATRELKPGEEPVPREN